MKTFMRLLVSFALAVALSLYAHRAHAAQTFSGPGLFVSQNTCTDILNPVAGQSWCFDSTNNTIKYWNSTTSAWTIAFVGGFPLAANANFNNFNAFNVNQIGLVQVSPPTGVFTSATCTGTCATTYTYEVTCVTGAAVETSPSSSVTATNATSLSGSNFNVISWTPANVCSGGYNVYGRTAGSLFLLASGVQPVSGAASFTDTGAAVVSSSYTITWPNVANPTVAIWDLRGANTFEALPINSSGSGSGSTTLTALGFTSSANHDLQIPVFAFQGATNATFTPPAGFSNAVSIAQGTNNSGLWGGTKDIAVAGAVPAQTGTTSVKTGWATFDLGILSANPASAITVVATNSATAASPFTTVTINDPAGTLSGDLEVVCASWSGTGAPTVPASFGSLGTATGILNLVFSAVTTNVSCWWNFPTIGASGVPPPTVNRTGTLQQTIPNVGFFQESMLGIQHWTGSSGNNPNGTGSTAEESIQFPMPLTVTACSATWSQYAGCAPFPTFAIKDFTANKVLCSSGTVSGTDSTISPVPTNTAVPANDLLIFTPTTIGTGCTGGRTAISAVFKE